MPTIVVVDLGHVTIDGVAAGAVADVLANHDPGVVLTPECAASGFRGALQAALIARDGAIQQAHADALAAKDAELARQQATIADLEAQVDALGGTELAQKLARQKQRQALREIQDRVAAELATIEADEAPSS